MPSLNQIAIGLIAEAMVQLRLAMGNVNDQQAVFTAEANITKTWQELLAKPNVPDRDQSLVAYTEGEPWEV